MKLSKEEAQAARKRAMDYEANMAVEGLTIHPDDRALMDYIDNEGIGYEEAVEMTKKHLIKQGVIPTDSSETQQAAE